MSEICSGRRASRAHAGALGSGVEEVGAVGDAASNPLQWLLRSSAHYARSADAVRLAFTTGTNQVAAFIAHFDLPGVNRTRSRIVLAFLLAAKYCALASGSIARSRGAL